MIPMVLGDVADVVGARRCASFDRIHVSRVTTDSREVEPGDLFIAVRGERFDGHQFIADAASKGAVACVVDRVPGEGQDTARPIPCLRVGDPVEALGKLAGHYRRRVMNRATVVVAVTGSNGKTTAKCMIDHVLQSSFRGSAAPKSFNNRIGVPLTLLAAGPDDRYVIVEIGTNAPGEVAALGAVTSPGAAVITSIGEAHLEGLGTVEGIAAEKASLLAAVRSEGLAVVNIDRPEIRPHLRSGIRSRLMTIGVNPGATLRITEVSGDARRTAFRLGDRYRVELPMPGLHHAANAAAAFAIARWFGVAPERIIERFRSFTPPPGRTRVCDLHGVTLVDDTYNANPASMTAAVQALSRGASGRRILVMGDMLELGETAAAWHCQVVKAALEAGIELLVSVGPAMAEAVRRGRNASGDGDGGLGPGAARPPTTRTAHTILCEDAAAAAEALMAMVAPGDTVWVKGSRAMRLERVVEHLRLRLERTAVA